MRTGTLSDRHPGRNGHVAGASDLPGAGAIARRPGRRNLVLGRDGAERRLDGLGRRCGAAGRACRAREPGTGGFADGRCGFAEVTSFPRSPAAARPSAPVRRVKAMGESEEHRLGAPKRAKRSCSPDESPKQDGDDRPARRRLGYRQRSAATVLPVRGPAVTPGTTAPMVSRGLQHSGGDGQPMTTEPTPGV